MKKKKLLAYVYTDTGSSVASEKKKEQKPSKPDESQDQPESKNSSEESEQSDESDTEAWETQSGKQISERMLNALKKENITLDTLEDLHCQQLVIVEAEGTSAEISLYSKDEKGIWTREEALNTSGTVGSEGVGTALEDHRITPEGIYAVGEAPTAGCVAVSTDMMKAYLQALSAAKNPYILIENQ